MEKERRERNKKGRVGLKQPNFAMVKFSWCARVSLDLLHVVVFKAPQSNARVHDRGSSILFSINIEILILKGLMLEPLLQLD